MAFLALFAFSSEQVSCQHTCAAFVPPATHFPSTHNEDWCLSALNGGKQKLRQRPSQLVVPSGVPSSVARPDV